MAHNLVSFYERLGTLAKNRLWLSVLLFLLIALFVDFWDFIGS